MCGVFLPSLPVGTGFEDPDPRSQNSADQTDPDPKHCKKA